MRLYFFKLIAFEDEFSSQVFFLTSQHRFLLPYFRCHFSEKPTSSLAKARNSSPFSVRA